MTFLAIINPAAGGGRCAARVDAALARLRAAGLQIDMVWTAVAGDATRIAREAYERGVRNFLAVGGDGTAYEIVNGLFAGTSFQPSAVSFQQGGSEETSDQENRNHGRSYAHQDRDQFQAAAQHPVQREDIPTLGFLPLGTGNSFLRDFVDHKSGENDLEHAMRAIEAGRSRACDVLRLTYRGGALYYTNLLSVGFAADVAALRHRRFAGLGQFGYLLSIFLSLARLKRRAFPLRVDGQKDFDRRRCLFLTFNNSKFTGGTMMIAPDAVTDDALIEYVRWGPIGRLGLIRNLSTLYDGTHTKHPLAEQRAVRHVEFQLEGPVDVMVDGEVLEVECQTIDVLPAALRVLV